MDDYSYAHPLLMYTVAYILSAISRGTGKSDLYYVDISKGAWGEPMNLIELNSESNENYPFVVRGNIFFSSDRDGSRVLDIYFLSAEKRQN